MDIGAVSTLYKNESYGNAAYHCQQALEKMIKSAVLKDGTLQLTGQNMSHIPFLKIFQNQLVTKYGNKEWKEHAESDIEFTWILVLNTLKKDTWFRNLFWKLSLNIPMAEDFGNDYYYIPPEHQSSRIMSMERFNDDMRLFRYKDPSKPQGMKGTEFHVEYSELYLNRYLWHRKELKKTYQGDNLLDTVFGLLALSIIAYPHEILGRYSEDICDRNSYEWYMLQKHELKKFIDEITDAITALDNSIESV